jgi:hypothetical protein
LGSTLSLRILKEKKDKFVKFAERNFISATNSMKFSKSSIDLVSTKKAQTWQVKKTVS